MLNWLPFGSVAEISAAQLMESLDELQLVDVRTGLEFRRGHIAGATHLPITAFTRAAVRDLQLDPQKTVVAICRSAHRSIPAVRQLRGMGFRACQLQGGMQQWWKNGLPCEKLRN